MAIPVKCECGRSMRVKGELAGRRILCPACAFPLEVPAPERDRKVEQAALDVLLADSAGDNPASAHVPPAPDPADEGLAWLAEKSHHSQPAPGPSGRAPLRPAKRPRPQLEKEDAGPPIVFEKGWFGDANAGTAAGILMVLIAVIWFAVGLANNQIVIYAPVIFVIGVVALIRGLTGRQKAP